MESLNNSLKSLYFSKLGRTMEHVLYMGYFLSLIITTIIKSLKQKEFLRKGLFADTKPKLKSH